MISALHVASEAELDRQSFHIAIILLHLRCGDRSGASGYIRRLGITSTSS